MAGSLLELAGRRRFLVLAVLLTLFLVAEIYLSGMYPIPLLRGAVQCASTSSPALDDRLQCLVSGTVGNDGAVPGVEFAVATGDGSYTWAGASGSADPQAGSALTADTPMYMASATKAYIATLVMLLSQDGLLSLDDPMSEYLPAELVHGIDVYAGHDYSSAITVRQLVSMTSGLPDYYEERGRDGKTMLDLFIAEPARTWTPEEMINRARTELQPHFGPGQGMYYSDTNYQLLGRVIEKVTHSSLPEALRDYLFRPLGLHHTWLTGGTAPKGTVAPAHVLDAGVDITAVRARDYWADGGLVSTPTDMIAFLRALNQGRLVTPESLATMQTWHDRDASPVPPIPGVQYGYGLWFFNMTGSMAPLRSVTPTWGATGSTGSFLYYSQDRDLYLAGSVNTTSSPVAPFILMGAALTLFPST